MTLWPTHIVVKKSRCDTDNFCNAHECGMDLYRTSVVWQLSCTCQPLALLNLILDYID